MFESVVFDYFNLISKDYSMSAEKWGKEEAASLKESFDSIDKDF